MIRVVFMGSADLSAVMLERLAQTEGFRVVGCVTQPDKPAGRSKKLTPCACKAFVTQAGIPCLTPEKVNTPESLAQIAAWLPDVIVVVAYGQFLSRRLLDIPTLGCINIHLSLLPRYRGASPIHAALLAGDAVTGVTAMLMDEGMDTGPILMREETPIYPFDTIETLHDRLTELGAQLLVRVLPQWAFFKIRATPQDPALATVAYKIRKSDGLLHWTEPTDRLLRMVRTYNPWPSTYTYLPPTERDAALEAEGKQDAGRRMFKILEAEAAMLDVAGERAAPGTVVQADRDGLVIRTSDGAIRCLRVQVPGGKPMETEAYLRGRPLPVGTVFDTPPPPPAPPPQAFQRHPGLNRPAAEPPREG